MSQSNGVIRVGRKGRKKFAFGEEGEPFELDVVETWQQWIIIDDSMRPEEDEDGQRSIPVCDVPAYYARAVLFLKEIGGGEVTVAEALDFLARLHEQFDELAENFRPKLRRERDSPGTSEQALRFSEEGSAEATPSS